MSFAYASGSRTSNPAVQPIATTTTAGEGPGATSDKPGTLIRRHTEHGLWVNTEDQPATALTRMTDVCRSKSEPGRDMHPYPARELRADTLLRLQEDLSHVDLRESWLECMPPQCRKKFTSRVDCTAISNALTRALNPAPGASDLGTEVDRDAIASLWESLNSTNDVAAHPVLKFARLGLERWLITQLDRHYNTLGREEYTEASSNCEQWLQARSSFDYGPDTDADSEVVAGAETDIHTYLKPIAAVTFLAATTLLVSRVCEHVNDCLK